MSFEMQDRWLIGLLFVVFVLPMVAIFVGECMEHSLKMKCLDHCDPATCEVLQKKGE